VQEEEIMNGKNLVIGSLVGLVALYILGYILFDTVFADFYAQNAGSATGVAREEPLIWATVLGTLSYAVLLTLGIGSRSGAVSAADGAKVGATIGFLLWFTVDFILFGYQNVSNLTLAVTDPVLELVRGGIAGAVIAVVLGKTSG
jgi:hypothetical protein